jgi:hypothetical protein
MNSHEETHMQNRKALTEEEDYDIVPDMAERIVQELIKTARMLSYRGYGITQLVFPDSSGCSFVSLTYGGVISEVAALLRAGCQPLGFVAAYRELNHSPFAEPWESGDKTALAELRRIADWLYAQPSPRRAPDALHCPASDRAPPAAPFVLSPMKLIPR